MSNSQNRARITQMLDLAELVADAYQTALVARTDRLAVEPAGPIGTGAILALSRDIDTLERIQRELAAMLDSRPLRPVPSIAATQPAAA